MRDKAAAVGAWGAGVGVAPGTEDMLLFAALEESDDEEGLLREQEGEEEEEEDVSVFGSGTDDDEEEGEAMVDGVPMPFVRVSHQAARLTIHH